MEQLCIEFNKSLYDGVWMRVESSPPLKSSCEKVRGQFYHDLRTIGYFDPPYEPVEEEVEG